jgi:superfamily I DNA/RNA helicase
MAPGEMAVFVRSALEVPRAQAAVATAGLEASVLDETVRTVRDRVPVGTMHLSKGLEFRAVAVMACDDEVLPLQARIEEVADQGDLEEVYDTERHLLYVACTRARDHLLVTGVAPASEFLKDLKQ